MVGVAVVAVNVHCPW